MDVTLVGTLAHVGEELGKMWIPTSMRVIILTRIGMIRSSCSLPESKNEVRWGVVICRGQSKVFPPQRSIISV